MRVVVGLLRVKVLHAGLKVRSGAMVGGAPTNVALSTPKLSVRRTAGVRVGRRVGAGGCVGAAMGASGVQVGGKVAAPGAEMLSGVGVSGGGCASPRPTVGRLPGVQVGGRVTVGKGVLLGVKVSVGVWVGSGALHAASRTLTNNHSKKCVFRIIFFYLSRRAERLCDSKQSPDQHGAADERANQHIQRGSLTDL